MTCWSGYADSEFEQGKIEDLKRHLVCVSATDGRVLWNQTVKAHQPEDPYTGQLGQHGYATHTPVTDGKYVYAFFGKSGVFAYDLEGNQLWNTSVGTESGRQRWGSAASPILFENKLIVNAADESQSIVALDTKTGKELWKAEAGSLMNVYNTPTLVDLPDGGTELVLTVPNEVWALNPDTGKLKWYAETGVSGNMNVSVQSAKGIVYAFGGNMGSGTVAIRAGGDRDVSDSHTEWAQRRGPDFGSPVLHEGHLYWVTDRGIATCMEADSGDVVYQERLQTDGGFPKVYASAVVAGGNLIVVSRNIGTFVIRAKPKFEQIALNQFAGDPTEFNATPAISGGRLYIRSNLYLYSVANN